jgi:hypothetical protein
MRSAAYSCTTSPLDAAAQIAAPRAWPSSRVDCGLTLTNTFSTVATCGRVARITSDSDSRIVPSRW